MMSQTSESSSPTTQRPGQFLGMWVGFLYILFFIVLDIWAVSVAGIFHTWVDNAIPAAAADIDSETYTDPLFFLFYFGYEQADLLRGYIASIIVSLPIFAFLAVKLYRLASHNPPVRKLRSRQIMIYITLIVTFLIMISNAIYAIFNFLDGNVSMNTLGHLFVTLTISGSIFVYFFREVYDDQSTIQ